MLSRLGLLSRQSSRKEIKMQPSKLSQLILILAIITLLIASPIVPAIQARQSTRQPIGNTTAFGTLLNPDGTLNLRSGFNGSFDAHGWRMTTTADGTPHFVAAVTDRAAPDKPNIAGDEWWDSEFQTGVSYPGYAASVYAIAVHGSDVYIGGTFKRAGGIAANSIVRYNTATQHWSPLARASTVA